VLSRHLLLVALCYSTIQTLARCHHIPFDHATNRVNAASLFFSFGYVKKQKKNKPSQRRFLDFLLRLRKKTETKKKKTKEKGYKAVVSSRLF
jgi:predicted ABC-type exoprotein transport system permease subunit